MTACSSCQQRRPPTGLPQGSTVHLQAVDVDQRGNQRGRVMLMKWLEADLCSDAHRTHPQRVVVRAGGKQVALLPRRPHCCLLLLVVSPPAQPPHRCCVLLMQRRLPQQLVCGRDQLLLAASACCWGSLLQHQTQQLHCPALQASSKEVASARLAVWGKLHAAHAVAAVNRGNSGLRQLYRAICAWRDSPNLDCMKGTRAVGRCAPSGWSCWPHPPWHKQQGTHMLHTHA